MKEPMNRRIIKSELIVICACLALFLGWLAVGSRYFDDYGGFTDELVEVQTGAVNLKYAASVIPMLSNLKTLQLPMYGELDDLPDLLTYKDRVYGVTSLLPTFLVNLIPGISLDLRTYLKFRRLFIFLMFGFGAACFTLYLLRRYPKRWVAPMGLMVLILSPRFFAESFYNSKDIVFFTWFLISLSCVGWYSLNRSRRALGFFCLTFGLTANARYFGIGLLPAVLALIAVIEVQAKQSLKELLRLEGLVLTGSLGVFYLASPYLWAFDWASIWSGLTFVTNLPGIGDGELFWGKLIAPRELPYYLAVWIGITTPLFYLVLALTGACGSLGEWVKSRSLMKLPRETIFDLFCLTLFLVYYALIVISKATIYHGWRHAYFLYAPMLVLIASGLAKIMTARYAAVRLSAVLACVLTFAMTVRWIAVNHPLDFAYFNALGRPIASGFSRDSWGVGSRPCIEYLASTLSDEQIDFGVNEDLTWGAAEFTLWALPDSVAERFNVIWQTDHAEAFCFSYKNTAGNDYQRDGFRLMKTFFVDGAAVVGAYQRE